MDIRCVGIGFFLSVVPSGTVPLLAQSPFPEAVVNVV